MQAVGDFDENDADVLGHGQEHLAQVLHLLVFLAGVLHARQLGNALDDVGDGTAELPGDVLVREGGVLNDVVQEGGHNAVLVQAHVGGDVGRGNAVRHIGAAVLALLPLVGSLRHLIRRPHPVHVHRVRRLAEFLLQLGVKLVGVQRCGSCRHGRSSFRLQSCLFTHILILTGNGESA